MSHNTKKTLLTLLFTFSTLLASSAPSKTDLLKDQLKWVNVPAMRLYLSDVKGNLGDRYGTLSSVIDEIESRLSAFSGTLIKTEFSDDEISAAEDILRLKRDVMLANPLLDGDKIVAIKYGLGDGARSKMAPSMCTPPGNYMGLMDVPRTGHDAQICELSNLRADKVSERIIFKPSSDVGIADMQLHWNGDRVIFSSAMKVKPPKTDSVYAWHVFEADLQGSAPRHITKIDEPDLEFADPCYLPDGRILFTTNIGYNGIPCENGTRVIHNLAIYNPKTGYLRKTSFDQDGNWTPTVMSNGRIMYTRWEYTDLTHYFSRIVMHGNPDGTDTKAFYGSGSYWPNSIYDMQQLPGHGSRFVGIVTGHHGVARSGRLFIFDPAKSRKEEKGVVQELPFKDHVVVPEIKDYLVDGVWPQFAKPFPLNDKYFVVTAKLHKDALWGIYLVDVFDNLTLIAESEGEGFIQPIPVVKRPTPAIIPDRVIDGEKSAQVFIQDIYEGEGLRGVPRGTVKKLRVLTYEYAYLDSPSDHDAMGIQSGWDIKRELGTVDVEEDGSAIFKIPANTPISLQPLDEQGRAVQWMRSWFTAMPGETLSCIGCHEDQNSVVLPKRVLASKKQPSTITIPKGGQKPFTFKDEVQPVLDRNCIACHDGEKAMSLSGEQSKTYKRGILSPRTWEYTLGYLNLHPYVYRQGPEADMYVMRPYEFHASNSELIQIIEKGHYGVKLTEEEMQALTKWIDLNAPFRGVFDIVADYKGYEQYERRRELMKKYANVDIDWRKEIADYAQELKGEPAKSVTPTKAAKVKPAKKIADGFVGKVTIENVTSETKPERIIEVTPGVSIKFVWIPAGQYTKGALNDKERPVTNKINVEKGFWISATEITNEQYKSIFPHHDSRFIGQQWKDHTTPGYAVNTPLQPVVRVSWSEAVAFCDKISQKTGAKISLPSKEQWEWACRAGSENKMWFGNVETDYSKYENMADATISDLAVTGVDPKPMRKNDPLREFWDFVPRDTTSNDKNLVTAAVGSYIPNPWGLYDVHGNVAEWTSSQTESGDKIACGGSWRDRAKLSTASAERYFKPWQAPYNVGFRLIITE